MHTRHAFAAALLLAGLGALATIGGAHADVPAAAESLAGPGPGALQAPDDPTGPKTRAAAPQGEPGRPVEDHLAAGASAFVPIPAYRMYDSRFDPLGIWLLGDVFPIDAITDENLHPRIPETATAVTFNVTVTQTEGAGYIQIFGPGVSPFSTSTVNWVAANIDVANSGSVQLGPYDDVPGYLQVAVGGPAGAAAHVVIDITGYYELLPTT